MAKSSSRNIRIVATLFGIACLVWCAWEPYKPDRLYHAVPLGAHFVAKVDDSEGWLERLASHPLVDAESAPRLRDLGNLLTRFSGKPVLISRSRGSELSGQEVWSAAVWVGALARPFRLALESGLIGRISPVGDGRVGSVWRLDEALEGRLVSFALSDGLLLVSFSDEEASVRAMLLALQYDRSLPAVVMSQASLAEEKAGWHPELRVWADWSRLMNQSGRASHITGRIMAPEETASFNADIRLKHPGGPLARCPENNLMTPLRVLHANSSIVLGGDASLLSALFGEKGAPTWWQMATRADQVDTPLPVVASMLRTSVPASVAGLGVPAFAVALDCGTQNAAVQRIDRMIDDVAEAYDTRLVPRRINVAGTDALVLDMAEKSSYTTFGPDERLVCWVMDRWVFVVNGRAAADYLLSHISDEESVRADLKKRELTLDDPAVLFGIMDPTAASGSLRKALAGYYAAVIAGEMKDQFGVKQAYRHWMQVLQQVPSWGTPRFVVRERNAALELSAGLEPSMDLD